MFHIFYFRFSDYLIFESFDPWYELRKKIGATGTFVVITETKIKVNHLAYIVPTRSRNSADWRIFEGCIH